MQNVLDTVAIATILVVGYAIVGAIQCLSGDISFEEYLRLMDVPVAGLAVGRGLAARK
jgi:hypothetical protein